ncbi:glycoside hydrolase superfamily [Infundibulicybe gibba]|nr:glycoside hydrolase superfamily [Infundibulicybe gibba]
MVSLAATFRCFLVAFVCFWHSGSVLAFSNDRSDNLAVYWGQDGAGNQQTLSFYCNDDTIDAIPMAFLYIFFGDGGKPVLDLANICSSSGGQNFPGTKLADCSFLAKDIQQCQSKGKIITLSLGGATAQAGFDNDEQAKGFANTIWNMFLGGQSDTRPFGNAVLDGVDLDIENGSSSFYGTFVDTLRSLAQGANKRYYVTAAPQCPFPDAKVGEALNSAWFDAVYVQFYNNFCETSAPWDFNFGTWDDWAKNQSPNPDVKVYLGAPASAQAAGDGYVDADTLNTIAQQAQKQYSSFGGVMLWDADVAYSNNRFDRAVKNGLTQGGGPRPPAGTSPTAAPKPTPTPTPSPQPAPPTTTARPPKTSKTVDNSTPTTVIQTSTVTVESTSFRDPRATARVKRPTFIQSRSRDLKPAPIRKSSRLFRN